MIADEADTADNNQETRSRVTALDYVTIDDGDTVEVTVDTDGLDGDATTFTVDAVEMPTLTVGVIKVVNSDAELGTITDESYRSFVEDVAWYMQAQYPTSQVMMYRYTAETNEASRVNAKMAANDFRQTHDTLTSLTPVSHGPDGDVITARNGTVQTDTTTTIEGFDVTLAVLPPNYFRNQPLLKDAYRGTEPYYPGVDSDGDGVDELQPPRSANVLVGFPATAAMEIIHHFINSQYPDSVAKPGNNYHTTNKLESTVYEPARDGSTFIKRGATSFMSHNSGTYRTTGTDAKTTTLLINNTFEPVADEGTIPDQFTTAAKGLLNRLLNFAP